MAERWRDEGRYRQGSRGDYRGGEYGGDYGRYGGSYGGSRGDYGGGREAGSYGRSNYGGGSDEDYRQGSSYGYGREGAYGGESGQRGGRYSSGRENEEWGGGGWEGSRGYTGSGTYGGSGSYGSDWSRRGGSSYGGYREPMRGEEDRGWWERTGDEVRSWFGDEDAERRRRMDEYRGRGPKGYTRSDDRIREDVCDRLCDDPRVDASNIEVSVANGEVTLSGTVDARDVKHRAEDCAEDVSGVKNVQNNLRVQMQGAGLGSSTTGASSMAAGSTGASTSTGTASSTTGTRTKQTV